MVRPTKRRYVVTPAVLLTIAVVWSPGIARGQDATAALPKGSRVAVVALNSTGGSHVDRVVGDMLTTALRGTGFRVLERQEIQAVLAEQRLVTGGHIDPATAVESGKIIGAQYLLGAKATEFGVRDSRQGGLFGLGPFGGVQLRTSTARVVLDARVIDVRTGEVIGTATGEGKIVNYGGTLVGGSFVGGLISLGGVDVGSRDWSESLLGRASRKAVDAVLRRLLGATSVLDGRILALAPDGVAVVSLGTKDRVRVGDRLTAYRVEALRDSEGEPVWTEDREVATLRVVEVRTDRCKAEPVSGDPLTEGLLVRKGAPSRQPGSR